MQSGLGAKVATATSTYSHEMANLREHKEKLAMNEKQDNVHGRVVELCN